MYHGVTEVILSKGAESVTKKLLQQILNLLILILTSMSLKILSLLLVGVKFGGQQLTIICA